MPRDLYHRDILLHHANIAEILQSFAKLLLKKAIFNIVAVQHLEFYRPKCSSFGYVNA